MFCFVLFFLKVKKILRQIQILPRWFFFFFFFPPVLQRGKYISKCNLEVTNTFCMLDIHTSPCLPHRLENGFKVCRSDAFEKSYTVSQHWVSKMLFPVYSPPEKKPHILVQICGTTWGLKVRKKRLSLKYTRVMNKSVQVGRVRAAFLFLFVVPNFISPLGCYGSTALQSNSPDTFLRLTEKL